MAESQQRATLGDNFRQYFRVSPALDLESINDVHFIRHEVYARDLGFEPVREDCRESDAYDRHSVHCLVRTIQTPPRLAGCARLIMTDPNNPDALLPFEKHCGATLDRSIVDPTRLPRHAVGEISRLAVMSTFRRRKGEQSSAAPISDVDFGSEEQPRFPYIPVGLYWAIVHMALHHKVEYLFTLTEPRLAEHFAKLGVPITQIGPAVELRGQRVPSLIRASKVYDGLRALMRPLWHAIHEQMDEGYAAAR